MNKEERIMTALRREEPDVVPTHVLAIDANNVDKILGKPPQTDFEMVEEFKKSYPKTYVEELNKIIPLIETTIFSRMMKAAAKIGFDACQIGIIPLRFKSEHEFTDIFGRIWVVQNNEGNFFPFYRGGQITSKEKWEKWPKPDPKDYVKTAKEFYKSILKELKGEEIVPVVTNDFAGVFESTWQGMGLIFFSKMLILEPKFIKQVAELYTDFAIAINDAFMDVGAKIIVESGDIAYKQQPMINPKTFEQIFQPCYKRITDAVHARKGISILHTDGFVEPFLDMTINAGFDGLHSLEPTAGVDLERVKKKVGNKLALLGNIDIAHVLSKGTKEDVENDVKRAIRQAGKGGGFIISPTNMHPGVRPENLRWMVEATQKYGKYPLHV
ncbi:MAG: uroporphyrinogen decarboxylase family protein [Candidatus Atabeyarchaeum deiterrae]